MDIKNLEYLEAVYRLHSFTKAAEELYISQPSITGGIQKLEKELGTSLIDRSKKPFQFTLQGERFMKHVYNILGAIHDAEKEMIQQQGVERENINLAWASTMGDCILPRVFTEFYERYPQYQITLYENTGRGMLDGLQDGSFDITYALIPEKFNPDLLTNIPVQLCQMYVILSDQNPLSKKSLISLSDMKNQTILSFPEGASIRTKIDQMFRREHIVPKIQSIRQVKLMEELIQDQYGITILPLDKNNSVNRTSHLVIRPLDHNIVFTKGFMLKRGLQKTDGMKALIKFVQECAWEG